MTNTMQQIKDDHEKNSNQNTTKSKSYEPPKMIFISLNQQKDSNSSSGKSSTNVICNGCQKA